MQRMSNKMKNMRALLLLLLMATSLHVFAQNVTLTGNVKDNSGEPIIGASVLEKGTSNGTITDIDGKFKLSVPSSATVVVSYIGMKTQEISAKGKTTLNVTLLDDSQLIEEVVVIGYGTVAKKDLTGSVSSVSAKQLAAIPVSSAVEAMTGKMAGVTITTTEGSPDADMKIRVRGGGSLSQDNSPLYIVDGFPVSSISDIAPTEIQSIDILKDASSTAIYGARGANGVVIVTTKSGSEGKTQVSFGASYGIRKATKLIETLNPYEYALYQYELGSTDYGTYNDLEIWKSVQGNDFQDDIFGRTGNQIQYNASVSGGTKEIKYNVSYTHNEEESIMRGSGFNKDNVNVKLNTQLNKWMKLDFNARLSYQSVEGLGSGADSNESNAANSIVANAVRFRPVEALSNNEDDEESKKTYNPLERLDATYKEKRTFNQNYNAGLNWTPFKNITVRTEFGYGWKFTDTDQVWEAPATLNSRLGDSGQPQALITKVTNKNWRNANTITYDYKKLFNGRDKINAMIGHEVSGSQDKKRTNTSVRYPSNFTIDDILNNMGIGAGLANTSKIEAKENMLSFFGRVNYTMMEKYLFTVTMRADGSSKFSSDNRWGFFPSAAFAWRMSDEAFLAPTEDWLSNLKLRLSFGTAGNNRINSGLITPTYSVSNTDAKGPFFNGVNNTMLELGDILYNPDLKWETTITRNLGIDYGFFNNRISGTLDFYWNTTKDLLMKAKIPASTGYPYQMQNFGQTSNKGIELASTIVIVDNKKFGLDFNFNISYNKNNIEKLNVDSPWQSSSWGGSTLSKYDDFKVEKGSPLGEVWGYKTDGFFTAYDEVSNPKGELVLEGTTWKLRDGAAPNDSKTITGGSYYPGAVKLQCDENGTPIKQKLGNTIAPWNGGFGFNGRFKNFDFGASFNYSLGQVVINATKLATSFYSGSAKNYNLNNDFNSGKRYTWIDPETGLNLGRPSNSTIAYYGGADNMIERLNTINTNANIYNPASASSMELTDYAVEKASFLRVNNITLGYTLPKELMRKMFMQNIRVYVTGYNLFCFTNYSGADPEVDTSSKKNPMAPGVDYAAYPKSRSFVGGVNVTF
ncbi:TonB-dependent receptor [Bacteroides sp. 224]|uniref:SusC/RagA family TonB-linked outer membrane protein n=1 Tax=Bacteroides sp. 224 TaxID=2302936 RepID=UPI0013D24F8F|nr:TonB-dependent receptor [Bacteroides sp. 224]NDV66130.1 TonB-dependent receptor [Bacteroides sp. 224]